MKLFIGNHEDEQSFRYLSVMWFEIISDTGINSYHATWL
jgi:hypothetical protein